MGLSEEIRQRLIDSFKVEQGEHVQKITAGLLALEKNPKGQERQTLLEEIFREAHSLKGSARAVGMVTVGSLGHGLESLLLHAKEGRLDFSPELFDLLYQTLDSVELVIQEVEKGKSAPPAKVLALLSHLEEAEAKVGQKKVAADVNISPLEEKNEPILDNQQPSETSNEVKFDGEFNPTQPTSSQNDETIRVSVSKLDALMAQFSELLAAKIRTEQRLIEIRQMQGLAANWQKEWMGLRSNYNRLIRNGKNGYDKDVEALLNFVAANQENLKDFSAKSNILARQYANDNMHLKLIIDEFQEEIKRTRMLPLSTITVTFGRMVRDLARQQGKQITFTTVGGDTELDKRVLEQVKDPLIHLLRNAIDHGIEEPEDRKASGKPVEGHIILSASQQGNNIVIQVRDNGKGLDLNAIRESAVRKGLISQDESEKMHDEDVKSLIFQSGLSTSKIITDISGRGVGMDVVRKNVEDLQGILQVESEPCKGTIFTMTLPLTLASSRGLLVKAGHQIFALPLTTIERMLQVKREDLASIEGKQAITYQGKPIALAWLEDLLELPTSNNRDHEKELLTIVVIVVADKRLGIIVDSLEGEQEIVIKNLGRQLAKVGGIAGATILGSGEVLLVLHTADLVKLAARSHVRPTKRDEYVVQQNGHSDQKTILVVDDSITTRTLEKNILEAAGYKVKLATDGEEALGVLVADSLPNLIISDINMPRLNGFEMTGRIKQDARYREVPVILVTSLDSPADKARGIEVGADAYIVKSSFDQGNLLETIEGLI